MKSPFERTNDPRTYTAILSTILTLYIVETLEDYPKSVKYSLVALNVFVAEYLINFVGHIEKDPYEEGYELILFD